MVENREFIAAVRRRMRETGESFKTAQRSLVEERAKKIGGVVKDWHNCHFCGEYVLDGLDPNGERHWLSDCRPDLVEHEPGPVCTWHNLADVDGKPYHELDCYAYQDGDTQEWGSEHKHFYKDGPM